VGDVAVVVQELVDARSAGVMFTQHPHSGDRSLIVIEAGFGLGEAVVGGEVVPDLYEVNKVTRQIVRRERGSKPHEYRWREDGDTVERRAVDEERAAAWSITDDEVMAISAMAGALEKSLGRGLDVEWAIGAVHGPSSAESLFALQVRPITVNPSRGGSTGTGQLGNVGAAVSRGNKTDSEGAIDAILGRLSRHAPGGDPS
jgi:pyruvate,water dikinase